MANLAKYTEGYLLHLLDLEASIQWDISTSHLQLALPHEEVCHGEVAHEKARHVHLGPGGDEHDDDAAVPQERQQEHDPHRAPEKKKNVDIGEGGVLPIRTSFMGLLLRAT